jgi:hypothetical protein
MFIDEIGEEFLERRDRPRPVMPAPRVAARKASSPMPDYEGFSQETKTFRVGGYVRHPAWGNGKVLDISGFGPDAKLTISFGEQQKRVIARYANLEIL